MSKKLIISESEKRRIRQLYSINEQDQLNPLSQMMLSALDRLKKLQSGEVKPDDEDTDDEDTGEIDNDESEKELNKTSDDTKSSGSGDFVNITKKVIDKFEGGYWNPACSKYPETKHPPKAGVYKNSSETMFGLDREAGQIESLGSEGKQFFELIDNQKKVGMENFCKKWIYNYRGGELENKLKELAATIMKRVFDKNSSNYLTPEAKEIIEKSNPLLLHFSYATWNGAGYFKKFAKSINDAVKSGKSEKELVKLAKQDRDKQFGGGLWSKNNEQVKQAIDKEAGYIA